MCFSFNSSNYTNNDFGIFEKKATIVKRRYCNRLFIEEFVELALKSPPKLLQAGYLNSPRRYNFRWPMPC